MCIDFIKTCKQYWKIWSKNVAESMITDIVKTILFLVGYRVPTKRPLPSLPAEYVNGTLK